MNATTTRGSIREWIKEKHVLIFSTINSHLLNEFFEFDNQMLKQDYQYSSLFIRQKLWISSTDENVNFISSFLEKYFRNTKESKRGSESPTYGNSMLCLQPLLQQLTIGFLISSKISWKNKKTENASNAKRFLSM